MLRRIADPTQPGMASEGNATTPPPPTAGSSSNAPIGLELHFFTPALKRNVHISVPCGASEPSEARFFTDVSSFRTYDVVLHRGADATGPPVAAAHFRRSRTFHLCLGDPNSTDALWVEMRNMTPFRVPRYELTVPSPGRKDEEGTSRTYLFRRTSKEEDGVKGARKILPNWKIVDTASGEAIAVYLPDWHRNGRLVFAKEVPEDLQIWATLVIVSLSVKGQRGGGG